MVSAVVAHMTDIAGISDRSPILGHHDHLPASLPNGAPEEIRTPDPQIRSLVLYPAELRARMPIIFGSGCRR